MNRVLIIGNGISRLEFDKEIREYQGEIWGCNKAYLEFGEILTKLTGHEEIKQEALIAKKENPNMNFSILSTNRKRDYEQLQCHKKWHKDSGTALVAEALHRGFDRIDVAGFDLGGPDLHSPKHEELARHRWVQRWVKLSYEFGLEKVYFWGYNHKNYIQNCRDGKESIDKYRHKYKHGKPHISTDFYKKIFADYKAGKL